MRRLLRSGAVAVALVAAAVRLTAQQPVIDPLLRTLLDPARTAEAPDAFGGSVIAASLGARLAIDADALGRERVGLLVEMQSAAALGALRALGAEIGAVIGSIATVRLPVNAVEQLAGLPLVRVQAARMLQLDHDSSMKAIGVDAVRQRTAGGWTGSTGTGVLVGIIDTGIDLRHADFHDDAGRSRVVSVWDHTAAGTTPAGFGYGRYCTAAEIQQVVDSGTLMTCPSVDSHGHGTHVAGTAAGDGSAGAVPYRYAGVAPEADLVIVKAGDGTVSEDRVVDALLWLREQSLALGRPMVVNMSFGHDFSPHDGSTLLEQVVDELAAPGFLMVLSAGNVGANDNAGVARPELIHARVQPRPYTADTLTFDVADYRRTTNGCGNFIWLSAWQHPDERLTVTVVRPNGTSVVTPALSIGIGEDQQGRIAVTNAFGAQPATAAEIFIELDGCGTSLPPAPGLWKIVLRPGGTVTGAPVDLYMHSMELGSTGRAYGAAGFDNRFVVSSPGAARRGITVGAFATRSCWPTAAGQSCYDESEEIGDLARFSGGGPTRDGRLKPEITAPGIGVVSALSAGAGVPADRVVSGGAHWTLEGTSMAAPHVTGALALLMQYRPSLNPEEVLGIFPRTSTLDAFTSRTYDVAGRPEDWWGNGKLHVPSLLSLVQGTGVVAAVTVMPQTDSIPRGARTQLQAHTVDAAGDIVFGPLEWTSLDPATAVVDPQGGVTAIELGAARIVAQSGALADTASITVVEPAVLMVSSTHEAAPSPANVRAGMLLPVFGLRLTVVGTEAVRVREIAFDMTGRDDNARVLLLSDDNGDGLVDEGEHLLRMTDALELGAVPVVAVLPVDTLTIGPGTSRNLLLAVQVSGAPPHGSSFAASLLIDRLRTVNIESREQDRVAAGVITELITRTTVLLENELFALSENPVRADQVIFNFATPPSYATVFTVAGSRVADLLARVNGDRLVWDLTSDDGHRIVPGVYLLVFRVGSELIREKLFVLSPRSDVGRP
ncbi:MAG: S8 family serine peptidase [Gemmatimonadota bacterium]